MKIESVLNLLAGFLLGFGGWPIASRFELSGSERLGMLLSLLGILLFVMGLHMRLARRVATLEGAVPTARAR